MILLKEKTFHICPFKKHIYVSQVDVIYKACKAKENHVSAEELGEGIEQDHHVILNNEMVDLQACEFHGRL